MPVVAQNFEDVLTAIENALFNEGAALNDFNQGSRLRILSRANARVISALWDSLTTIARDSNVATAVDDGLDLLVNALGVQRRQGSYAEGSMIVYPRVPGNSGIITDGDIIQFDNNNFVVSLPITGSMTLGGAYSIVPIQAANTGTRWNLPPGSQLLFVRPDLSPLFYGVVGDSFDLRGNPLNALTGGEDRETNGDLRIRFANYMQSLTRATYQAVVTALGSIQGLKSLNVIEYLPAVGFITVFVDDGTSNPLVSQTLLNQITSVLFSWKAAGIAVRIQVQEKVTADIEVRVKIDRSKVPQTMEAAVEDAILAVLDAYVPGQTLFPSVLDAAAHSVPGVLSVDVITPTAPVEVLAYQVFRPKTVTTHAVL